MQYTPRRKLTREFKLEAVRQVALSEKPKAQLARELGVRVGQLRTWRLEFEKEAVTGIAKPDRSAAEDVEQLRRENAKLKMEIEILKKAAVSSTGQSNVLCRIALEVDDGANGEARSLAWPEEGVVVSLEGWSVLVGDRRRAWQARCLDTRRASGVWWYRSANAIPI
jgi:transposase